MWSAQTITPLGDPPPHMAALRANFSAYGLGWGLTEYRGFKTVSHTGGLLGFVSRLTLVPDLNLGVVVLTNQQSGGAFQALTYRILDHYMNAPATDWTAAFRKSEEMGRANAAEVEKRQAVARASDSKPSLPLAKYAGRYTDAWCSQDPARVAEHYATDGSLTINDGPPSVGRAAITEAARAFMVAFPLGNGRLA